MYVLCFSANTRCFSPVTVRLIKLWPVPGQASDGHRPICLMIVLELFKHRTMCANADRVLSGRRCNFTLNDTTKRRTGAVEF